MTTPADELRTAAARLRTLATAASTDTKGHPTAHWAVRYRPGVTPGAPELRDRPCALVATDDTGPDGHPRPLLHGGSSGPHGRGSRPAVEPRHGEYIAAMDPNVGLALADWLTTEAQTWAGDEVHSRCSAQTCTLDAALAVARNLLGGQP